MKQKEKGHYGSNITEAITPKMPGVSHHNIRFSFHADYTEILMKGSRTCAAAFLKIWDSDTFRQSLLRYFRAKMSSSLFGASTRTAALPSPH